MIYKAAAEALASGVPGAKTIQGTLAEARKLEGAETVDVEGRPATFGLPINEITQTDPENPLGIWHVPVGANQGEK